jgi:predicted TIM-barrel fold metal-dependent hydrolase
MSAQRVIDCDVHCSLPAVEALYPYLPPEWVEYFAAGFLRRQPAVGATYPSWSPIVGPPAAELTLERLQETVLSRADLAILHCYWGVESFTHPYLAAALATAVNRWIATEWLDRDERLLGSAVVTPQYQDAALAEIERIAADKRFVQILVPARSVSQYGNQRYWPIWEAAHRHGLRIAVTFGGGTGTPPTPVGWLSSYWEEYVTAILNFESQLISLAVSGLFDRHPDMRFVIAESGWTYLPAWLWRMDQEWRALHREVPWLTGAPSSYVRRHFRFTSQPIDMPPNPAQLADTYAQLESDEMLMFGSDYPHVYAEGVEPLLEVLSDEQRQRLLWDNADELYGLGARIAVAA